MKGSGAVVSLGPVLLSVTLTQFHVPLLFDLKFMF